MQRETGFTLFELILVILVISVGLAGLGGMFVNANTQLATAEDVQKAAQYGQECAERVLAIRRYSGYTSTDNTTMCDVLPALDTGFSRTLSRASNTTNACPSGGACRNVTITVTKGSISSVITVMLVQ